MSQGRICATLGCGQYAKKGYSHCGDHILFPDKEDLDKYPDGMGEVIPAIPNRNARVYFQFDDEEPRKFYDLIKGNRFELAIENPADHLAGNNEDPLDPPPRTVVFRSEDGTKTFRIFVEPLKEGEE